MIHFLHNKALITQYHKNSCHNSNSLNNNLDLLAYHKKLKPTIKQIQRTSDLRYALYMILPECRKHIYKIVPK